MHETSPSAFLFDYRPGTQAGWTTSSGATDGLEDTAALAAAAASRFLASQATARTMPPPVSPYATSPPFSFAAPASPGRAQYFSSEPLIVSGQAGADGGRGRDVAPVSLPSYPLEKATSGVGKGQPGKRRVRVCSLFACDA